MTRAFGFVAKTTRSWFAGHAAVAVATVVGVIPFFSVAAAPVFTLTNTALPGVAYSSVVCGDFNLDGKADVLLTGADVSFNGVCQIWQNRANGVFTNTAGASALNASVPAEGF